MLLENGHGRKQLGKLVFTSVFPILHCSIYVMSTGDARRSQSATFCNPKENKEKKKINVQSVKSEALTPTNLVQQTSTSTLTGENEVTETPFLGFTSSTDKQKEKIALKLNRLKDKTIRYELHKDFLKRCLAEKLVPKGIKNYNWKL